MEHTLEQLYEMQKVLDARIIAEKGLEGVDLLPNTVLALQVELGELANEWRGFKHWSNDRSPRTNKKDHCNDCLPFTEAQCYTCNNTGFITRNPLLEEYVDCLHFFLSIARQLGLPVKELERAEDRLIASSTAEEFSSIMTAAGLIDYDEIDAYYDAWNWFMALGAERLGFTFDQIAAAYIAKNEVNHRRQSNGY
ncbi:MAG: dUTP diphosphatase [Cohnella sp.]|nr:dUTP diphosphatase [Cohnella sp.]